MLGSDPISYAVAFTAGFVSFASPCVLPLVPAYLSFLSGVAFDETKERRWAVFFPTAAFVGGFTLTFTLLGASVGLFGTLLLEERRTLEMVGGAFLIAMGLLLLGRGVPMFLMRERRFHLKNRPVTLVGSSLAGMAFALGWTPCIGPTLGAALTLAAGSGSWVLGASLLIAYSLGMAIPFLLCGLFWHQATAAMGFMKRNLTLITRIGAAMMVLFGVLVLTGAMTRISAELQGFGPGLM